jgi:hypothetical protein
VSEDWVKKHIEMREQKLRDKQDAQKRAQLAESGALDMLHRIKHRVREDLKAFRDAGVYRSLELGETSMESFSVTDTGFVERPSLLVSLEIILVKYSYRFPAKKSDPGYRDDGVLRVCSDLTGITQVYKNGDAFADESGVSEFLLKPLLDFIDK